MNRLFKSMLKASLLSCAFCAALVPGASAAPQWDYAYIRSTTTPDAYPGGAWDQELYLSDTDTIAPVGDRLYFNLRDSLFFYGRGEEADPRISASSFTYEWRQEVISPGITFSMAMYYAEDPGKWIELVYNGSFMLITDGMNVVDVPISLATGQHTYRLVKSDSQVELYVDGTLTVALPVGAYTVNYLELSGWGMEFAPYEAYWDHVAYTRGAYTPTELPSPTEAPVSASNSITKRNGDAPLLTTIGALSDPLVSYVTDSEGNAAAGVNLAFSITRYPLGATGQELTKTSEQTDADGLADVRLKLGNMPAEYDVTATCTRCEASVSSVTFTCCGKLTDTDFKQYDIAWSTHSYDGRCHLIGSTVPFNCNPQSPPPNSVPFSISQRGCAMTAMADVLNYYHDRYALTYATTTPDALNQYLRNSNGYDNGDVDFNRVWNYTLSERTVCYSGKTDLPGTTLAALRSRIDANLAQGNPVVLRVPSATNPSHFVVATGKCAGNYLIADPGQNRTAINPSQILGIRVFSLVTGSVCPTQ